jgi:sialate O-acetylesterase
MIEADWGGTVAEAWVSAAGLKAFPEFRKPIDTVIHANEQTAAAELINNPSTPTVLFNSMIDPLTHFRIKGVIWYQGEANAIDNRSAQYRRLFPALIEDWRRHWGYVVPFFFVQLAGYGHNEVEPAEYPWADLREAQSMTLSLPATGMATAIDIGDENDIHPKDKQDVAHRLVLAVAHGVYGDNIVDSGPTYLSMQIEGNRIRIKFANTGSGLLTKDKYGYGRGFEIAAGDGRFHWAQGRKEGHDIVVCSDEVSQPVAVRYDWSNTPDGNVYNKEGLPALPFRTDAPKH